MDVCRPVTYISSLSFDARRKKIGASDRATLCQQPDFCLGAEILNCAVISLIFDATKKLISVLDRVVPCQIFLSISDF